MECNYVLFNCNLVCSGVCVLTKFASDVSIYQIFVRKTGLLKLHLCTLDARSFKKKCFILVPLVFTSVVVVFFTLH